MKSLLPFVLDYRGYWDAVRMTKKKTTTWKWVYSSFQTFLNSKGEKKKLKIFEGIRFSSPSAERKYQVKIKIFKFQTKKDLKSFARRYFFFNENKYTKESTYKILLLLVYRLMHLTRESEIFIKKKKNK